MKTVPKISETEWEIMRVIWARHPITAAQVLEQLNAAEPGWHPKTARTLLGRLVQKKALSYQIEGQSFAYEPLVSEQECVATASNSFLERVFGGSLKPLLAHFVEQRRLTKRDLEELNDLLEQKNVKRKGNKWKSSSDS